MVSWRKKAFARSTRPPPLPDSSELYRFGDQVNLGSAAQTPSELPSAIELVAGIVRCIAPSMALDC